MECSGKPPADDIPSPPPGERLDGLFESLESALPRFPFRVTGADCTVELRGLGTSGSLLLNGLDLDAYRLPEAREVNVRIDGIMNKQEAKKIGARLRFAASDDFDLRVSHAQLEASDIGDLLPAGASFLSGGSFSPSIRVAGMPGDMIVLSVDSQAEDLSVVGQPEFLPPFTGDITATANYAVNSSGSLCRARESIRRT